MSYVTAQTLSKHLLSAFRVEDNLYRLLFLPQCLRTATACPQGEAVTSSSSLNEGLRALRKERLHQGVVVKVRVLTTSFYLKRYLHLGES